MKIIYSMVLNAVAIWDFTISMEFVTKEELRIWLKKFSKKYTFQGELGKLTGFKHWQGRVSLKVKSRKCPLEYHVHWSVTSSNSMEDTFYVMKEDTRIEGPYTDKDEEFYVPKQIVEITQLFVWQKEVIEISKVWDSRHINVIVDKEGCKGKSTLVGKMCCELKMARKIPPLSNYKELMNLVFCMPSSKVYLVDMPRALDKNKQEEFFSAIENIKDGHIWDNRYTYKEKWIDSPNIWVFTNVPPNRRLLSEDRWKMFEIDGEGILRALRCNNKT